MIEDGAECCISLEETKELVNLEHGLSFFFFGGNQVYSSGCVS